MLLLGVVEADPLADDASGLEAVGELAQIDGLVFERTPQPLDEDVVQAPAPAVHRYPDTGLPQAPGEGEASELAALVGIEDLQRAMAGQRLVECLDAEARIQGVRQALGQHMPARPVHDRQQVKEAAPYRDVGDGGAPALFSTVL